MAIWRVHSGDKQSAGSSNAGFTTAAEFWVLLSWVFLVETTCFGACGLRERKFGAKTPLPGTIQAERVSVGARAAGYKRVLECAGGAMEGEPDSGPVVGGSVL